MDGNVISRFDSAISRRGMLLGGAAALTGLGLAGCTTTAVGLPGQPPLPGADSNYNLMYAAVEDGGFKVPAIPYQDFDPRYWRQVVDYATNEKPGTIVVEPQEMHLYWVLGRGAALRYGIGVGKAGFGWSGRAKIRMKREWPTWTPPDEMIARRPHLEKYADGMEGGLDNPLGARSLYLWQGYVDTLYRIHGTYDSGSVGRNVSSGCIRMWHQDAIDLYARVPLQTEVLVVG